MSLHYVYTDGVWDLFHCSHLAFLNTVRQDAANVLKTDPSNIRVVAGVVSDQDVQSYKRVPIMNETQRTRMLEACTLVDVVVPNSPLVVTEALLSEYNIRFVYHGDDSSQSDFFEVPIRKGMMRYVKYNDEVSTTRIIEKIRSGEKNTGPK